MNNETLEKAANIARGLAMDAVHACKSGHLGLPLGAAEIGAVLFGHALQINPEKPRWINRDRFILSAGHGSMFLYSWLHLSGFDLSLDELKNFRKLHSKTPGHPEYGETAGVECTTGPLGQGVGNAVGMAMSAKMAEARYNTEDHRILDYHIVCLVGDGCLQEGVASEAASLAGHLGLDNLILIYDSNDVTLDAAADKTQSENTELRFQSYGFDVHLVDGHDMDKISEAFENAKNSDSGKPQIIIAKTIIGKGISEVAGTFKAHGEAGANFVEGAKKNLGLPDEQFYVSEEVKDYFKKHHEKLIKRYHAWEGVYEAWRVINSDLHKEIKLTQEGINTDALELLEKIPEFDVAKNLATRAAGGVVLQKLAEALPLLISGSADLHGSTKNYIESGGDFSKENRSGRNILFGIREHAMGAIINGFGYDKTFIASGATFLTFSDYMRPSIRLAALANLSVFYIFTHDSVGVGEDGPTHQPVETVSALRCIPNLDVLRPADPEETAGAFVCAVERCDGPTAIILSRQSMVTIKESTVTEKREGVLKGGYIVKKEIGELKLILLGTGSELQHAIKAADAIGEGVRVVSLPSFERFERQTQNYKDSILPSSCFNRIAIEAGVSGLWYRYVGDGGKIIAIDRFGISAPGDIVMNELGINENSILEAAKNMV